MARQFLNIALTLEAFEATPDGAGGRSGTGWIPLGTLWGEVTFRTGRRQERDSASLGRVPVTITVRAAPIGAPERPLAGQRFRESGRAFRILAVAEKDASGRLLRCYCEEEVVA